ncbi:effector-associated constant component EACC1 [Couchioplanes caeruleus]|uniref:Uncharacterized protein n=2 Tax=Couchioplanes caeruleus TaxID=56438 RepID=A0A1K0GAC3_9ACTN|nr:hypothetical protein [Couchioplanes caeruleus]OJF14186.1 hypothetical protein BG844_11045 [Couchioplanes caeruleus subsp. caeruleus]ROP28311.1 hypothetical protein EDD30_1058 [Couchioplanes caeruleus]
MSGQDTGLDLAVRPGSSRFDTDDERWTAHELELFGELRREVGGVRRDLTPAPGEKGMVETIVVALASAGTFNAALQCLQAWLTRDRTRSIELSCHAGEQTETIVLKGTEVDQEMIDRFTASVLNRLER